MGSTDATTEYDLHLPAEQIGQRRPRAAIRHVNHVDAGQHIKQSGFVHVTHSKSD